MNDRNARPARLLDRGSWPETQRVAEILRKETVGGILLLLAGAVLALVWANLPWSGFVRGRCVRSGSARQRGIWT